MGIQSYQKRDPGLDLETGRAALDRLLEEERQKFEKELAVAKAYYLRKGFRAGVRRAYLHLLQGEPGDRRVWELFDDHVAELHRIVEPYTDPEEERDGGTADHS